MEVALTKRQEEIVQLASKGLTDKQIGQDLGISSFTVRNLFTAAFERTDTISRTHLVATAIRQGWIA